LINKFIKYNGITSKELGLRLVDDIEIESTEKNIELIEIDGVNGGKIRNKKNLKPMINEEELTEAAKAAYESHKKILYLSIEDAFDIEFPAELEPLAELMYCTGYANAISEAAITIEVTVKK